MRRAATEMRCASPACAEMRARRARDDSAPLLLSTFFSSLTPTPVILRHQRIGSTGILHRNALPLSTRANDPVNTSDAAVGCARAEPSRADFSSGPPFVKPPGRNVHGATAMPTRRGWACPSCQDHESHRFIWSFRQHAAGCVQAGSVPAGKPARRTSIYDLSRPEGWIRLAANPPPLAGWQNQPELQIAFSECSGSQQAMAKALHANSMSAAADKSGEAICLRSKASSAAPARPVFPYA